MKLVQPLHHGMRPSFLIYTIKLTLFTISKRTFGNIKFKSLLL